MNMLRPCCNAHINKCSAYVVYPSDALVKKRMSRTYTQIYTHVYAMAKVLLISEYSKRWIFLWINLCCVWAHESHFILQMQHRFDAAVAAVAAANAIWFILWFLFWMYAQRCTEYVLILCKMLAVLVQCGMLHKHTFHVEMSTCGICISYTMHGQDNVTHFK